MTCCWLDTVLWAADSSIPVQKVIAICRSLWDGGIRCQIMDGFKVTSSFLTSFICFMSFVKTALIAFVSENSVYINVHNNFMGLENMRSP